MPDTSQRREPIKNTGALYPTRHPGSINAVKARCPRQRLEAAWVQGKSAIFLCHAAYLLTSYRGRRCHAEFPSGTAPAPVGHPPSRRCPDVARLDVGLADDSGLEFRALGFSFLQRKPPFECLTPNECHAFQSCGGKRGLSARRPDDCNQGDRVPS